MHYKEKLSAFLSHELPADVRREVGEHLLHCQECRREHDEIKYGFEMARKLGRFDAPPRVWNKLQMQIEGDEKAETSGRRKRFDRQKAAVFAAFSLIVVCGAAALVYLNFSLSGPDEMAGRRAESSRPENISGWMVEKFSGGSTSAQNELLKVGGILETGENARARVEVADIGEVKIAPNSLVRLVNTSDAEHRLALEYGSLEAKIFAPPRLFVVDTPTAKAVDLGCAYTLDVDRAGNSRLRVTGGYVALERDGLEAIVPAGAVCLTRRGRGIGTPFFESASEQFKEDVRKFDFETGGETRLDSIIEKARPKDSLTLWHLLSRVPEKDRRKVFEKLLAFAPLPESVTPEGIFALDKNMLNAWRSELELLWYEEVEVRGEY